MKLQRFLPLLILVIAMIFVFVFGLDDYLTFQSLKNHRDFLKRAVQEAFWPTLIVYGLTYIIAIALSLPGGAILTITGGFLFGQMIGTISVVMCATLGATLLFIIARYSAHDLMKEKAGPWLQKLSAGFQKNAFSYLLMLRLVPLFPFFVVNLVPALLNVRLYTFVAATAVGIIPGTFVYISVGVGLNSIFASGDELQFGSILTPEMLIALTGLGLLSLIPVIYKRLKG